ncbi:putative cytochrome P450 28a5 [Haematobia irritans]|uniref:putative cytochrome P450 28a5 n=1 Tax=Haematobia irritans TaxID=7368 RepID=UPI003F4FBD9E
MIATILWLVFFNIIVPYTFLVWKFNYWTSRRVRGPKPRPLVGNFPSVFTHKRHISSDIQDIYETYKNTDNYVGVYNCRTPQLMVIDAELMHRILVTDFKHFHDNEVSTMVDEKSDLLYANNPFALTGEDWYDSRNEIKPSLALLRIKLMFPVISKIGKELIQHIEEKLTFGDEKGIDGIDLSLRFVCAVVSENILNQPAEMFSSDPLPIVSNAKQLSGQSFIYIAYTTLIGILPILKRFRKMRFTPKSMETFLLRHIQETLKERRKKGASRSRSDFWSYLIQLQEKKRLREKDIRNHAANVIIDSITTIPDVLSHCLLMLGRDSFRQAALRSEIFNKLGENNDFEIISDMEYLDACVHETIRLFPPTTFMTKSCTKPIEMLNKKGHILKIETGTKIILPIHATMNNCEYFPNPEKFQPERFLNGGLKRYRNKGLYLSFSDGPRNCLGKHFALIQIKVALVEIVRNYEITINARTRSDNKLSPTNLLSKLEGGVWLNFRRLP